MQAAYSPYQVRLGGARLPPLDADYRDEIRDYPVWVVEQDGTIVAGLIMMFHGDCASIANVAVMPGFQGQGVGGYLMGFAERMAKDNGCSEMRLATHLLLTENVALYEHLGWIETDRDEVRVHMKKRL